MARSRILALMTAVTLLTGGLTACSSDDSSGSTVVLHAGQLGSATTTQALLAAAGLDEGMDYTIEWSLFENGPSALEAVPSGDIDVVMMADTPMIFAQSGGTDAVIVASGSTVPQGESQVELLVPADSSATSIADLAGKKVAMNEGTIMQYSLIKMLSAAGMSYDDIEPVNLSPSDAATALESGAVDAIAILDPQRARLIAGGAKVIDSSGDDVADAFITVATQAALADEGKEAAIEDFVIRVSKAYAWAQTHLDSWAQTYSEISGLELETAELVVARQAYQIAPIDDGVIAAQQDQADVFTSLGLLTEQLDVSAEYDDRFNTAVESYLAESAGTSSAGTD